MYIKKGDYQYLENLYKGLDDLRKKRFLEILLKAGAERIDREVKDISRITILNDDMSSKGEVEEKEIITRTMIKKAYKASKEEDKK